MSKKIGAKKNSKKKSTPKDTINQTIVENFVGIQKVMTELSEKFDKLTNQLSELLNLFEESAKTLVRKEFEIIKEKDKPNLEILSKMDKLLDQNKLIARGLTMINEKPEKQFLSPPSPQQEIHKQEIKKPLIKKIEERKGPRRIENDEHDDSPPVFDMPE